MRIKGLDEWLTTPPEEDPDWVELADKVIERFNKMEIDGKVENEDLFYLLSIIEGLRVVISEELGI